MKKWKSTALWEEKHGFQDNMTTDEHDTEEQALAVCDKLMQEGLGGERCHFPLKTWVAPITSPPYGTKVLQELIEYISSMPLHELKRLEMEVRENYSNIVNKGAAMFDANTAKAQTESNQ